MSHSLNGFLEFLLPMAWNIGDFSKLCLGNMGKDGRDGGKEEERWEGGEREEEKEEGRREQGREEGHKIFYSRLHFFDLMVL